MQADVDPPVYLEAKQYLAFHVDEAYESNLETLLLSIEANETVTLTSKYRTIYVTAPPLPRHFVPRPAELDRLRRFVIADNSERQIALTAVRAMGHR